jgi:tetratricopeptide (TPR) repeat protein
MIITNQRTFAQLQGQAKIDSLLTQIPNAKKDTNHVNLLNNLASAYSTLNPDEGIKFDKKGLELSNKINWDYGAAQLYNTLGSLYFAKSEYSRALSYCKKALKIAETIGNERLIGRNLGNIGILYANLSDNAKALEYYQKSLKIAEKLGDKKSIQANYGNIAVIYRELKVFDKSLYYNLKALKIAEDEGDNRRMGLYLGNIGNLYRDQNVFDKAVDYYYQAVVKAREIDDKSSIGRNIGNIGNIFLLKSDYINAFTCMFEALRISEELGDKRGASIWLGNIGGVYLILSKDSIFYNIEKNNLNFNKKYNLEHALSFTYKALEISQNIHNDNHLIDLYKNLEESYLELGNKDSAYKYLNLRHEIKDSIFSLENTKKIASLEASRESQMKDLQILYLQSEKKTQQQQFYFSIGGIFILVIALVIEFFRFREKKKLSESLIIQKSIVEEKNEQIYGSIRYASTIQHAILPWDTTLRKSFDKYFIFYLPKDIVSGDSYWFKEVEGIKFLAVIDCTGHGIPGSMLTVIASSVLDDAVLGKRLKNTGEILTYMNDKVTEVLNQRLKENEVRDGMEVALIAIHQDKIQFSGAGRPLYLKNSSFAILKTDRRAIAGRAEDDHYLYSSLEFERNNNLMLYLTTDGYADQMNEEGKKYSSRRFLSLLESIADKPLSEQQQLLEQELTKHQGDRNQIDDITIIGVKL